MKTNLVLGLFLSTTILAACAGFSEPDDVGISTQDISVSDIMTRAQRWVDLRVPYCGGPRGGADIVCGGICERPAAPWDDYRTDCSGFVSWVWQIPSDPATSEYIEDQSGPNGWSTVPLDQLRAGDAVVTKGHIKLFSKFEGSNAAEILEEYDCGKVARRTVQSFTRSGDHLWFDGDDRTYHGIRRNAATGGSTGGGGGGTTDTACGVGSDKKLHCTNHPGAALYASASLSSAVVNHLRTSPSYFNCWGTGQLHSGGNTTWYETVGDDNGSTGWIPAVSLNTPDAFDKNPSASGLAKCGDVPSSPPPGVDPSCEVQTDKRLHCTNTPGSAMYAAATTSSAVVNHLRTSPSWFDCWQPGQLHAGGNTTWYHTQGDDNASMGFVPAVDLQTKSAFDADPTALGLRRCN